MSEADLADFLKSLINHHNHKYMDIFLLIQNKI
jgi:hypothetical protein